MSICQTKPLIKCIANKTINKYYCRSYIKDRQQRDIRRKYIHATSIDNAKNKYKALYGNNPEEIIKVS